MIIGQGLAAMMVLALSKGRQDCEMRMRDALASVLPRRTHLVPETQLGKLRGMGAVFICVTTAVQDAGLVRLATKRMLESTASQVSSGEMRLLSPDPTHVSLSLRGDGCVIFARYAGSLSGESW